MKNIIFDLYGTLIDIYTNESSNTFWKRCANKFKKYNQGTDWWVSSQSQIVFTFEYK